MIITHTSYYLLSFDGRIETENYMFGVFARLFPIGIFPLLLPATAGAMLISRVIGGGQDLRLPKRIPLSQSWGILKNALLLMLAGLAINWALYRHLPSFYPYFQSTLEFLAISFVLLWICFLTHFASLYFLAVASLVITAAFSDLRFGDASSVFKILFESDGRQYLWPVFPWVGLVALGAGLQWRKDFFFQSRVRTVLLPLGGAVALALVAYFGWPLTLNPANIWGEAVFQKGGGQAITLMALYFFFWNLSGWLCARFPPLRYGIIHVLGQGIFYVYVFHMALGFYVHNFLIEKNYAQCLLNPDTSYPPPCMIAATCLFYPLMFGSSWLFAWLMCRYFMNVRLKIRLRPAASKA